MDYEQRDHIISRVVDRRESASDWEALAQLESKQEPIWRELAQALRCEAELRSVMAVELARADRVSLPPTSKSATRKPLPTWSGWLAAAACLVAWMLSSLSGPAASHSMESPADNLAQANPEEVAPETENTDSGTTPTVITELPMVVVDTKVAADGEGFEVVYLRRVLERRRVDQVMELTADESGALHPVPVDHSYPTRPEAL